MSSEIVKVSLITDGMYSIARLSTTTYTNTSTRSTGVTSCRKRLVPGRRSTLSAGCSDGALVTRPSVGQPSSEPWHGSAGSCD